MVASTSVASPGAAVKTSALPTPPPSGPTSGGVVRLLINPDQRAALAADPALLAPAVEEILRSALPHLAMTTSSAPG